MNLSWRLNCRHCNGTGEHDGIPCPVCDGTGKVTEGLAGG
jgi:DnaJ-class molecular chaperone